MAVQEAQEICERGQELLMQTNYIEAEAALVEAERIAWAGRDFDTLARLYMPLQEARRQRRLRCGEGVVCLNLLPEGPADRVDGRRVVENYPHGQLLVAGWGTIEPALQVRQCQKEFGLYVETFLGALYPVNDGSVVVIAPLPAAKLPPAQPQPREALLSILPHHCIVLDVQDLPAGSRPGDDETYAQVMSLWERLHAPYLAAADATAEPIERIEAYRQTIEVDYACELAHQKLADVARELARRPA